MQKVYIRILALKESQMRDTIWYSMGSICSSASSMVILLIVTRIMGQEMSGIFSLAWSAAQLMLTIGWFSTRQYQVSDINEKIGYYEYMTAKAVLSVVMLLCGIIYGTIYRYDKDTMAVMFLLCILMIAEVFADFYSSYFQQKGKLHIGGKSYVIRNITYIGVFTVTLCLWRNIYLSVISSLLVEAMWLFIFDYQIAQCVQGKSKTVKGKNVIRLFVECAPLFIGSFIASFVVNIPKNAIHIYMNHVSQASYNILFMPTAVINMLNMFICVPFYGKLALLWQEKQVKVFVTSLYKIIGIVLLITAGTLIVGGVWGIEVLSWLYGIELSEYQNAFIILLIGGGCYGVISLLTYVVTVFRKQRIIVYVYLLCVVGAQTVSGVLVRFLGMLGAALTYTLSLGMVCIGLIVYIKYYLNSLSKQDTNKE